MKILCWLGLHRWYIATVRRGFDGILTLYKCKRSGCEAKKKDKVLYEKT